MVVLLAAALLVTFAHAASPKRCPSRCWHRPVGTVDVWLPRLGDGKRGNPYRADVPGGIWHGSKYGNPLEPTGAPATRYFLVVVYKQDVPKIATAIPDNRVPFKDRVLVKVLRAWGGRGKQRRSVQRRRLRDWYKANATLWKTKGGRQAGAWAILYMRRCKLIRPNVGAAMIDRYRLHRRP